MKISKEQFIFVSLIVAMLGVCVAVFFFYLKPKLEKYQEDERISAQLEETLKQFDNEFEGVRPSDLITEIQSRTQPWMDSRLAWGEPFNVGDWLVRAQPRPEEQYPRFYYDAESKRLLADLHDVLRAKMPDVYINNTLTRRYPQNLRDDIDIPSLEDWNNVDEVTDDMVNRELRKLSFGISLYEWLVKYNPWLITNVEVWPPRTEQVTGKVVTFRTVGIDLQLKLADLVKLLEQFRLEDRYFNVDGIKITWNTPWYEPYLQVQMLVSQAVWKAPDARDAGTRMPGGAPAAPGGQPGAAPGGMSGDRFAALQAAAAARASQNEAERKANEPGVFGRAWRWIKRNIFYISG